MGDAGPRKVDFEALAKTYEPVVEKRSISCLKPNPRNARTHSRRQIAQLTAIIKHVGFIVPIIIDEEGNILAGHGHLEATRQAGLNEMPIIQVKHLTPELKRAFMLANNRLAELAGCDEELLVAELLELSNLAVNFEFEVTGFDTCDLDGVTAPKQSKPKDEEVVPELDRDLPPVSAPGDLWQLGDHLLYCGAAHSRPRPTRT